MPLCQLSSINFRLISKFSFNSLISTVFVCVCVRVLWAQKNGNQENDRISDTNLTIYMDKKNFEINAVAVSLFLIVFILFRFAFFSHSLPFLHFFFPFLMYSFRRRYFSDGTCPSLCALSVRLFKQLA